MTRAPAPWYNLRHGGIYLYKTEFYETSTGYRPAEAFLDALDIKLQAKMARTIALLAERGPGLRGPYSKPLSDGILELRATVGSNTARVLYFFCGGRVVILTNGFVKKKPRTPPDEIALAKAYRADYIKRKGLK